MYLKMGSSVDYLGASTPVKKIGSFTVNEAQTIARQREIKESLAVSKDFIWLSLRARHRPRFLDLLATVFVALYIVAAVALSATLLF
jgi:hypothetical protein